MPEAALLQIVTLLLATGASVFFYMCIAYLLSVLLHNAGIVDVFWGAGFGLIALVSCLILAPQDTSTLVLAGMLILASLRLTWHIGQRFVHEYPKEDARYTAFRKHFSKNPKLMTFLVFQLQGLLMTLVALPFYFTLASGTQLVSIQYAALAIYLIAWVGEALSDLQLAQFKKESANQGKTCQIGLWRLSRHPNYFFQWLLWVSYAIFVLPNLYPWSLAAFVSPMLMLHFLINVTGVKATEEHALESRQDYKAYQENTSMFIPWPFKTVPRFLT